MLDVYVDGNYAYIAEDYLGLTIMDITDPAEAILVFSV
jgi:hypothetical protein